MRRGICCEETQPDESSTFRVAAPQGLGLLAIGKQRKRKSWSFERLEDRLCFSAAPLELQSNQLQTVSISSDTPEGAAAIHAARDAMGGDYRRARSAAPTRINTRFARLPNDPLFVNQWHLLNTGQEVGNPDFQHLFGVAGEDINVVPVWNMGYHRRGRRCRRHRYAAFRYPIPICLRISVRRCDTTRLPARTT